MVFPSIDLPVPLPSPPMEAKRVESIPHEDIWVFEPKWDGFRALVFRSGSNVVIQSKNQRPLTRYFPELEATFARLPNKAFVLDLKIKHFRTADCVVAGYRTKNGLASSLILGLFDRQGQLRHVGHTSSLPRVLSKETTPILRKIDGNDPFDFGGPGGPSRWSKGRSGDWQPVEPRLVAKVRYDHFSQGRFRHGSKFLRWRPDKDPDECHLDQVEPPERSSRLIRKLGIG